MLVRRVEYFVSSGLVALMLSSQASAQPEATAGVPPPGAPPAPAWQAPPPVSTDPASQPQESAPPTPAITGRPEAGGSGFIIGGVRWLRLNSINDRMRSGGYPVFGHNFYTLGGGGQVVVHRFLLGGEGNAVLPFEGTRNAANNQQRLSGGFGLFRFGYAIVDTGGFRLFPLVGVGVGGMTLTLSRKADTTFSDVLASPAREASMSASGLLLDAGIGADYRIAISRRRRHTNFFSFGLRGGYMFVPYTTAWNLAGSKVADGPSLGLAGPYVQLLIGFGGSTAAR